LFPGGSWCTPVIITGLLARAIKKVNDPDDQAKVPGHYPGSIAALVAPRSRIIRVKKVMSEAWGVRVLNGKILLFRIITLLLQSSGNPLPEPSLSRRNGHNRLNCYKKSLHRDFFVLNQLPGNTHNGLISGLSLRKSEYISLGEVISFTSIGMSQH